MEALQTSVLSVEDYLSGELRSEVRHEYVAGSVYAMAGASEEHNDLARNLLTALWQHLRAGPCKVFMADMKVRLERGSQSIFYYPDVMVVCDPRDTERYFKRFPKVIIEVLSPDTERTDEREKFWAYTSVETFDEYVLVAQDRMEVSVFRREKQWAKELLTATTDNLVLASLNFSVPLATVYERVKV